MVSLRVHGAADPRGSRKSRRSCEKKAPFSYLSSPSSPWPLVLMGVLLRGETDRGCVGRVARTPPDPPTAAAAIIRGERRVGESVKSSRRDG